MLDDHYLTEGLERSFFHVVHSTLYLCSLQIVQRMNRSYKSLLILVLVALALGSISQALPKGLFERQGRVLTDASILGSSEPLILSKYLHDPATARSMSKVIGVGNFPSYSGYFTVNATFGSNMFFWYFPAQNGNTRAPLIMFLQGGPGASSMFGLFSEMGPYTVAADGKTLVPNPNTWNQEYSMVRVLISSLCRPFPPLQRKR